MVRVFGALKLLAGSARGSRPGLR